MFMMNRSEVIELCDMCFGGGRLKIDTGNGGLVKSSTCPRCNGSGRIVVIDTTEIIPFVEED